MPLLSQSAIEEAMLAGLKRQFKSKLREVLREVADEEIGKIVEDVSGRMEVAVRDHINENTFGHEINISWLLKKQE